MKIFHLWLSSRVWAVRSREGPCHVTQGGSTRFGLDWRKSVIVVFVELVVTEGFQEGTEELLAFCVGEVVEVEVIVNSNGL